MQIIQQIPQKIWICIFVFIEAHSSCLNELIISYLDMRQKRIKLLVLYWFGLFVDLHNDLLIQIIFFLTLTKRNGLDFFRQSSEYISTNQRSRKMDSLLQKWKGKCPKKVCFELFPHLNHLLCTHMIKEWDIFMCLTQCAFLLLYLWSWVSIRIVSESPTG